MVPYLIWSIIRYLLSQNKTIYGFIGIVVNPNGYFWFLWTLWIINLLFIFGDTLSNKLKIKQELTIGGISMILVSIMTILNLRLFGFQFISYYFLFYVIGYYINKYKTSILARNKAKIVILFLIWLAMGSFWDMHSLPIFLEGVTFVPSSLLQYAYRFFTALVAIYGIFCIAPKLLNTSGRVNQKIVHIGQISLGIYVVHLLLISHVADFMTKVLPTNLTILSIISTFIIALIVSVALVEILLKNKYTSRFLLGKL